MSETEQKKYHHFVVNEKTGKMEVLNEVQPGILSYTYDPLNITRKDFAHILGATSNLFKHQEDPEYVQIRIIPIKEAASAIVLLDVKNRSNIELGTMHF